MMHDEQDAKWVEQAKELATAAADAAKTSDDDMPEFKPFAITPSEFIARLGKKSTTKKASSTGHTTCNANLMRNGADYSVYVNTGHEFDGSDGGASPDEAIGWGKIRINAKPVKVCADATIAFLLIVSQTFAKDVEELKDSICWLEDAN
ncbi:hypothetical protein ACHAXR_000733 [Thalassiosira sp. AJA248-18]